MKEKVVNRKHRLKRTSFGDSVFDAVNALFMIFVSIVTFYPFYYLVMLSFSGSNTYGKFLLVPKDFSVDAYVAMTVRINYFSGLTVSIARSIIGPVCTLFIIFMCAYILAKPDLVARKFFSRYIVFSMYFSAGLLPVYINISQLKLSGTFLVYILPALVNAYEMILIRTFIEGNPPSLAESALIDGANDFQIAFKIVFPLCLPVLAAVGLFEFINQWNAYVDTLLYNSFNPELFTLQYILTSYLKSNMIINAYNLALRETNLRFSLDSLRMAMTVIVCIPIVIVYPFLQKYFIKGLLIGSVKG